jgi:hypothetical protein
MPSLLKRNILVALICALPAILCVESAAGHSGGGSSSAGGSSGGHGGGHGGDFSGPSSGHSSTGLSGGHSSTGLNSGHSPTGLNSAHMSGASRGGHFASNPVTDPAASTGGPRSGRFVHTVATRTSPVQNAKQRQFFDTGGYVPSNLRENDELWWKRHRYHRFSSP